LPGEFLLTAFPIMLHFPVVRGRLLIGHILLAVLCLALGGISVYLLLAPPSGMLAAAGLVILAAILILAPAAAYRIYLLLTAEYEITPAGALTIRFGARREVIPVETIEEIRSGGRISDALRKAGPGWVETWQGNATTGGEETVEWVATDRGPSLLLLISKTKRWAISPADPTGLARTVADLSARGSLEKVEAASSQPSPFILDILKTRSALVPLIGGWALLVALGALLLAIQAILPTVQTFRFTPSGLPSSPGSPSRLLILPLTGGAVWIFNAILGWRAWRTDQRLAALALWITACAAAAGLWAAALLLIRAG
jgi:hypothetical protein